MKVVLRVAAETSLLVQQKINTSQSFEQKTTLEMFSCKIIAVFKDPRLSRKNCTLVSQNRIIISFELAFFLFSASNSFRCTCCLGTNTYKKNTLGQVFSGTTTSVIRECQEEH